MGHHTYMVALLGHLEGHHLHLVVDFVVAPTHEALDGEDGVLRVGDCLPLGYLAHQPLAALGKGDDRGGRPRTFFVRNHFGLAAFKDGYARVGGAQIDTDNLCHG
jgi:hypothetical protein